MGIFKGKRRTNIRANHFGRRSRQYCRKPKKTVNNCNLRTDNQKRGRPKIITSMPKPARSIRRKRVFVYRPITATPIIYILLDHDCSVCEVCCTELLLRSTGRAPSLMAHPLGARQVECACGEGLMRHTRHVVRGRAAPHGCCTVSRP